MPRSRLYERSDEGQIALPNHWLRECVSQHAYSTYNQVTLPAPRYPAPLFVTQTPPHWSCTQLGFTTGRLRNSADVANPNRCLQWSEGG
jgi:hypothetical protein